MELAILKTNKAKDCPKNPIKDSSPKQGLLSLIWSKAGNPLEEAAVRMKETISVGNQGP